MGVLTDKYPEKYFYYFEQICGIPHGSGNVKKISDFLVDFAKERDLEYRQDEKYNVIIWKKGSPGYEDSRPVIIQGHMDMVAVKDDGVEKDMETEGLDLAIHGDMLYARGTSLGGDDGIAVAYALALLDDDSLAHPPLEIVITTDEEVGMLGADYLDTSDLSGRLFLNIDSEDEGIFTVSCAGGATVTCFIPCEREKVSGPELLLRINGLTGGHSGAEIRKGTLNAGIAMGRLLYSLSKQLDFRIVSISGGEKDNAIPVWSEAVLALHGADKDPAQPLSCSKDIALAKEIFEEIRNEYQSVEPDMKLSAGITAEDLQGREALTETATRSVITALMNYPNGIQRMNPEMKDMVQTSLSLGVLRSSEDDVRMTFCVRSSSETEKEYLIDKLESLTTALGGHTEVAGSYPGWEYRSESEVRDAMIEAYRFLYGEDPVVEGIHAGLECGLFAAKMSGLDAISFGPQMHDIHTTRERLEIESTRRTWELLVKTLEMFK